MTPLRMGSNARAAFGGRSICARASAALRFGYGRIFDRIIDALELVAEKTRYMRPDLNPDDID